ncbi:MAG: hypothetical protein A2474_03955 [Elusimicrobia bacterium RIFOXYC2_FULL_34_12]|nr:MAG: hypothetical protein A2474_03955 [Elusimicrobia bacterium RIFOXYC2_FULL_34_12]OGS38461.1 MAG: hypothetical protein A2551_06550 [Elusimicrobia bacterium RIFOXYD2_FULL_34_30]
MIVKNIEETKKLFNEISVKEINKIIDLVYYAYKKNKQIFIMGNGGSASTASHFACDLGKGTVVKNRPRLRVISLNDNISLMTALSNDCGYESVFTEQLKNLVNQNDIVIVFTASGNSPNILNATKYAKSKGAITVGFIGFGGGKLKKLVDYNITFSNNNYGQVESIHSYLTHLVSQVFRKKIENE